MAPVQVQSGASDSQTDDDFRRTGNFKAGKMGSGLLSKHL